MGLFDFLKKEKPVKAPEYMKSSVNNDPTDIICTGDDGGAQLFMKGNDRQIVSFKLSINNCTSANDVYEGEFDESGAKLTHLLESSRWEGNKEIKSRQIVSSVSGDIEFLKLVLALMDSCRIENWDGFRGSNPPGVLDGSSMSFFAERSDGSRIEACGTNNFPKHYGKFRDELGKLINYGEITETEVIFHQVKLEVPDSWVGKVTMKIQPEDICFELTKGKEKEYLLRVDCMSYGYSSDDSERRVGRIIGADENGEEKTFFVTVCPFDNLSKIKSLDDTEDKKIYEGIMNGSAIKMIKNSIGAIDGWTFYPEEGTTLYFNDARELFGRAYSLWLSLYDGGDFMSGCREKTIYGIHYKSVCASYERPGIRNKEELRQRLLTFLTADLTEQWIHEKQENNGFYEEDYMLYTDFRKQVQPDLYGSHSIHEIKQIDAETVILTVVVAKAAPTDKKYSYSTEEYFDFEIVRNEAGKYVFKTFPMWMETKRI